MSNNLKTFSIKNDKEKCSIRRLNVPSEVECWALNTEIIVNKIDYTDKFDTSSSSSFIIIRLKTNEVYRRQQT